MICGRRALRLKSACTAAPAGRGDGRAATACSCGAGSPSPVFVAARRRVSTLLFERGSDGVISPAPLVCKKGRVLIRINRHGGYYYYDYVIAPVSGRVARALAVAQLAPPSSHQCAGCAFPSCSRNPPLSRAALDPFRALYRGITA